MGALKAATKHDLSRNLLQLVGGTRTDQPHSAGQHWWAGKRAAAAKFILKLLFMQSTKAFTTSHGAVPQSGEQKRLCYRNAAPWSCLLLSKHYSDWNTKQIFTLWTQTFNSTGFSAQWWNISQDNIPRPGAVVPEGETQPSGGAVLSRDCCSKLKGWDLSPLCTYHPSAALAAGLIPQGPGASPFLPGLNSS